MVSHSPQAPLPDLFRQRLDEQINMKHPLVRLARLMAWDKIHRSFAGRFSCGHGGPALPARLIAGLLYLQHAFDASDEAVVNTWMENPYWQFFTGEGTMIGGAGIHHDLFRAIRLQIAVARAAVMQGDATARALMLLIREGQLAAAADDPAFGELLERVAPDDADLDLAVELYNGHQWTSDPLSQRRNLLAAAAAHFEARKPVDRLAAVTAAPDRMSVVQVNTGPGQRVAGRDFVDNGGRNR